MERSEPVKGEVKPVEGGEVVEKGELDPEARQIVEKLKRELNPEDSTSVLHFGEKAQAKLNQISSKLLEGVKNKELGEAGETINRLISTLKGFKVEELASETPWWKKLLGFKNSIDSIFERFKEVKEQVDFIANHLEEHRYKLKRDLIALENLYKANLDYLRELELYIKALEERLKELEERELPELEKRAKESGDLVLSQKFQSLLSFKTDLERRLHDLLLTRQVTIQNLTRIKIIQENDKTLIDKITSLLLNTLPLWKNQLVQLVAIERSKQAASSVKEANDFTNQLLEQSAEGLREANKIVREEAERGVFDVETVKKANQLLIETLNDSLEIAQKGREMREKARQELEEAESRLKEALLSYRAKRIEGLKGE
jgi:uncharacterized protein YaaN involved in tellurite resistance